MCDISCAIHLSKREGDSTTSNNGWTMDTRASWNWSLFERGSDSVATKQHLPGTYSNGSVKLCKTGNIRTSRNKILVQNYVFPRTDEGCFGEMNLNAFTAFHWSDHKSYHYLKILVNKLILMSRVHISSFDNYWQSPAKIRQRRTQSENTLYAVMLFQSAVSGLLYLTVHSIREGESHCVTRTDINQYQRDLGLNTASARLTNRPSLHLLYWPFYGGINCHPGDLGVCQICVFL